MQALLHIATITRARTSFNFSSAEIPKCSWAVFMHDDRLESDVNFVEGVRTQAPHPGWSTEIIDFRCVQKSKSPETVKLHLDFHFHLANVVCLARGKKYLYFSRNVDVRKYSILFSIMIRLHCILHVKCLFVARGSLRKAIRPGALLVDLPKFVKLNRGPGRPASENYCRLTCIG